MKKVVVVFFTIAICFSGQAQFSKLGKKLEKKAKDRLERKVDRTMDKGLDKVEEGIDGSTKGKKGKSQKNQGGKSTEKAKAEKKDGNADNQPQASAFKMTTKFDFVPGDNILVSENFTRDNVGDFPANWNTNGSGEIVLLGEGGDEKWARLTPNALYIPDLPSNLPEEYTIEFDLDANGLDHKTSSVSRFFILLEDNNMFKNPANMASVSIPLGQFGAFPINVQNRIDGERVIYNDVNADVRAALLSRPHISIAVNKKRLRMWINERKYVDVPRLIAENKLVSFKFRVKGTVDGKEDIFLSNLKIAEGGLDLRGQLLAEGRVSTNGILFNVNSDQVKPASYGVIRQIALAMQNSEGIKVKIIGHTDSDGDEDKNLILSKKRAESVKAILVDDFNIASNRLTVDGKGESSPMGPNDSPESKAANRRVEFIVQ